MALKPVAYILNIIKFIMFNSKTKFSLISSALAVIATSAIAIACTSQEDIPESSASIVENNTMLNDTILIETDAPLIQKSNMGSVSVKTYNLIQSLSGSTTRSDATPEVYYLYDDMTEKSGYAIANPNVANGWIFECSGRGKEDPVIILFEQIEPNKFVTKDKEGNILRYFTYNPEKRELWTYNNMTRGMSAQDKILCNSMFSAAAFLVCEALAVPSGGASLLVGLGFTVASTYVCD